MSKPKGGRGHRAPYDTAMARVPVPLKNQVQELVDRYQEWISQGGDPLAPPPLLDAIAEDKPVNEFKELRQRASQQEKEIFDLHEKNGDLNLEVEMLRQQLADINKLVDSLNSTGHKLVDRLEDAAEESLPILEAITDGTDKPVDSLIEDNDKPVDSLTNHENKPVDNLPDGEDKPVDKLLPLRQGELARRLGLTQQAIGKHKNRPSFPSWSAKYDPDGFSWEYTGGKYFNPIS